MKLHRAEVADAPAPTRLINAIIAIGGSTAHEDPFTPERFAAHDIAGPEVLCCHLAGDDDGRPLGFQGLSRRPCFRRPA